MELPKYLIRPSDLSLFELLENGLYAKSSDVNKDYVYEMYDYKNLINLGFINPF